MEQLDEPMTIAERIERLPLGRFHRRFIALVSLGNFFDLYDIFIVAYIGAALQQSGFLTLRQFTFFVAAGFLGMFVGTVVFGMGSDRMGRRSAFILLLLIYSVFTFVGAFAPTAAWLIALRFFAGVGIGAEIVVIDTYVTEVVPGRARGRYVAITQVAGFCAVPVAAVLSRLLVPTHFLMSGWRWVMVIGASGALLSWWFRRRLPESPRWLESRGRVAEANAIMSALESESFSKEGKRVYTEDTESAEGTEKKESGSFWELWRAPYVSRTVMLVIFQALQTIGFYGFANWAPTFLLKRGVSLLHSLEYTLVDCVGFAAGAAFGGVYFGQDGAEVDDCGFGFAGGGTWDWDLGILIAPAAVVGFGALLTLANYWFSAAFHAYQAELFPTRLRATGVGFTYSWSRLSAAFTSILIGAVLVHGVPAVFAVLAVAMILVAVVVGVMGPRTNGLVLEEIAQ